MKLIRTDIIRIINTVIVNWNAFNFFISFVDKSSNYPDSFVNKLSSPTIFGSIHWRNE